MFMFTLYYYYLYFTVNAVRNKFSSTASRLDVQALFLPRSPRQNSFYFRKLSFFVELFFDCFQRTLLA
jgi:hypothetical protein